MTGVKNVLKIPIGDWSNDGHGQCDYYKVESNVLVEEVREAHFLIKEKTGIDVGKVCSEYQEPYLTFQTVETLINLGFNTNLILDFDEKLFEKAKSANNPDYYEGNADGVDSETIAHIWLFLLNKVNPEMNLKIIPEKEEMLVFYGRDKKGRHINSPGYGCFH